MMSFIKNKVFGIIIGMFMLMGCILPLHNSVNADVPTYEEDFSSYLDGWVIKRDEIKKDKTLRQNVVSFFYPNTAQEESSYLYELIKQITLGTMILFIVWTGASLLMGGKKPEEVKKQLYNLLYILLGGVFIYAAGRLFGDVMKFNADGFTTGDGIGGATKAFIGEGSLMFVVLSAIKGFAFFLAVIMIVITGFKVMAAGEGEKGKKLVKGLINVIVALLIVKGVDFVYYVAADSATFVKNAADFIINVAKVFGWIYGVITVIMVIVAGYLYITDGGSGSNFKKASNILVNILLSGLVLFGFLLITYQIFAEFQTGGDAVTDATSFIMKNYV